MIKPAVGDNDHLSVSSLLHNKSLLTQHAQWQMGPPPPPSLPPSPSSFCLPSSLSTPLNPPTNPLQIHVSNKDRGGGASILPRQTWSPRDSFPPNYFLLINVTPPPTPPSISDTGGGCDPVHTSMMSFLTDLCHRACSPA